MRWCGAQSAYHLGEKRGNRGVVGEVVCVLGVAVSVVGQVVCVLGVAVSVVACCSHANP